jgi:hypothetical protein
MLLLLLSVNKAFVRLKMKKSYKNKNMWEGRALIKGEGGKVVLMYRYLHGGGGEVTKSSGMLLSWGC